MHNFKELNIWIESRELSVLIYKETLNFPDAEKYGLSSQIRRAAFSIPSNIAEGSAYKSKKDFSRFIRYAIGSSFELETQLLIASDVDLLKEESLNILLTKLTTIQKMLRNFDEYLNKAT